MTQGSQWQPGMMPHTIAGQQQKAAYDANQAAERKASRGMGKYLNPDPVRYNTSSPIQNDSSARSQISLDSIPGLPIYQPCEFQRPWFGKPRRILTENELNVIRWQFGNAIKEQIFQMKWHTSGRTSYYFNDCKILQLCSMEEQKLAGGKLSVYFPSARTSWKIARALVEVFEGPRCNSGKSYPLDFKTLHFPNINVALALRNEEMRRHKLVADEILKWRKLTIAERKAQKSSGQLHADSAANCVGELIERIKTGLTPLKCNSWQMSAAYRIFVPWGDSMPIAMPPSWQALATIAGI